MSHLTVGMKRLKGRDCVGKKKEKEVQLKFLSSVKCTFRREVNKVNKNISDKIIECVVSTFHPVSGGND